MPSLRSLFLSFTTAVALVAAGPSTTPANSLIPRGAVFNPRCECYQAPLPVVIDDATSKITPLVNQLSAYTSSSDVELPYSYLRQSRWMPPASPSRRFNLLPLRSRASLSTVSATSTCSPRATPRLLLSSQLATVLFRSRKLRLSSLALLT